MLVLYETPAGYALFQIKDESKIQEVEDITQHFADADSANKLYARFSSCSAFPRHPYADHVGPRNRR